jgi:hypothetical protein
VRIKDLHLFDLHHYQLIDVGMKISWLERLLANQRIPVFICGIVPGESGILRPASVVQWPEFLATDSEVRVRFPAPQDFLKSSVWLEVHSAS